MSGASLWSSHLLDPGFDVDESAVEHEVEGLDDETRIDYERAVRSLRDDATTVNPYVKRDEGDRYGLFLRSVVLHYRLDYDMRTATLIRLEPSPGE